MTCKELAELLMEYCDGDLPADRRDLVCEHIRICIHCQHYTESYQVTMRLCRDLPGTALPEHIVDKLRAAIKEEC